MWDYFLLLRPAATSLWCGLLQTLALSLSLVPKMGGKANVYLLFHITEGREGRVLRTWASCPEPGAKSLAVDR